jgi:hypothetical protein
LAERAAARRVRGVRLAALALCVAGLSAATGAQAAERSTYWQVTRSGTQPVVASNYSWCSDAPIADMLAHLALIERDVPGVRACQRAAVRAADGSAASEITCRFKPTTHITSVSRTTISGTPHDARFHSETRSEGWVRDDSVEVVDMHFAYLGECPAAVKPGQFLNPNGEIYDPHAPWKPKG